MRIFPDERYIMRLKGTLPKTRLPAYEWARSLSVEECIEGLRKLSGQDFGHDAEAWERWWAQEKQKLDIDPDF
ncbi:unnamed protein product [Tuwongella immobilis]|uniref:Uncharacterized protein n=1 Tax=Tuwongella immobilis TaxID=692036 RepID=A0A6C2YW70_9BACT|nr:unnamed protein product [Tuwongella immobilis]VTS07774.1 unnamed protein product [Tuwongella immobilis]